MKTVVVNLKNFTLAHDILVLGEDNELLCKSPSSMKNISENIVEKCHFYNSTKVKILGNAKYTTKISQDIKQLGLAKYSLTLDIEII